MCLKRLSQKADYFTVNCINKSILQMLCPWRITSPQLDRALRVLLSRTAHAYMLLIQGSSARSSNEPRLVRSPQFSPRLPQTHVSPRTLRDACLNGRTLHVDLQSTFLNNRIINSFTTCQADFMCAFFVRNKVVSLHREEWD